MDRDGAPPPEFAASRIASRNSTSPATDYDPLLVHSDPIARPAKRAVALLASAVLLCAWAIVVARYLLPLAFGRHFHVDEIQIAYNAALLGLHGVPEWMNFHAPLVVPLSWIAADGGESWPRLLEMRAVFVGLFLLDLVLIAVFASRASGWLARSAILLGATLVEPLWRHGFEIRHDVLVVAGSLALYALAQRAGRGEAGTWTSFAAGAIAAAMQLNSFKAASIWPPALLLVLGAGRLAAGRSAKPSTLHSTLAMAAGFGVGLAGGFALLGSAGIADDLLHQFFAFGSSASEASRFAPGGRLLALLLELPHLAILAAISLAGAIRAAIRGDSARELPSLLTSAWLLLELVVLHLNPVPFSYNFVHLLPFLFLAAIDGLGRLWERWPRARLALVAAAAAASIATFALSWRHDLFARLSGAAQRKHVEAVEALTATDDPVLDGAGLVLTRRPPGRDWMLHSLTMPAYDRGERESFASLLESEPAPVLLTNYRWEWLGSEDRELVRARYRPLGPRFLVLGGADPRTEGLLTIHRPGRYLVQFVAPVATPVFDGAAMPASVAVQLAAGEHAWSGGAIDWLWLGPHASVPPDPGALFPNRDLFVSD